jgi:hypothetical protein
MPEVLNSITVTHLFFMILKFNLLDLLGIPPRAIKLKDQNLTYHRYHAVGSLDAQAFRSHGRLYSFSDPMKPNECIVDKIFLNPYRQFTAPPELYDSPIMADNFCVVQIKNPTGQ